MVEFFSAEMEFRVWKEKYILHDIQNLTMIDQTAIYLIALTSGYSLRDVLYLTLNIFSSRHVILLVPADI